MILDACGSRSLSNLYTRSGSCALSFSLEELVQVGSVGSLMTVFKKLFNSFADVVYFLPIPGKVSFNLSSFKASSLTSITMSLCFASSFASSLNCFFKFFSVSDKVFLFNPCSANFLFWISILRRFSS